VYSDCQKFLTLFNLDLDGKNLLASMNRIFFLHPSTFLINALGGIFCHLSAFPLSLLLVLHSNISMERKAKGEKRQKKKIYRNKERQKEGKKKNGKENSSNMLRETTQR
jgi:hypothetical protein